MISSRPALALPRVLLLAALLAAPLAGANAQAVTAEGGSIAIGGNVSNSTIGPTPEQIRDMVAAVLREESAARAEIAALGEKLNVTTEAVVTFLRILGENQVPLEKLPETLGIIAERHVEMLDRLAALAPEDAEIQAKVDAARAAIKEGDYDRADQLLSEAEEAERAAIAMAEELEREARAAADRRRLNAAAARAERGEITLTQLDYLRAAGHFEQASRLVPSDDDDRRGDYLNRYASALYRHGDERGDNVALLSAIDVYRQALEALPRARAPLQWEEPRTTSAARSGS